MRTLGKIEIKINKTVTNSKLHHASSCHCSYVKMKFHSFELLIIHFVYQFCKYFTELNLLTFKRKFKEKEI